MDPAQVLAQDRGHRHPVTGVNAVGVGDPHALGDGAIGQGGHLARVGEVHRQGPRLAGHHGADEIGHQLARAPGGDLVGSHEAPDRGVVVVLVGLVPGDAVVVHAPGAPEVGLGGDEAGEEFHHVGVGGSGQDAEALEELQLHRVVEDHVGLGPLLPVGVLVPMAVGGWRVHPDGVVRPVTGILQEVAQQAEAVVVADGEAGDQGQVIDAGHGRLDLVHAALEDQAHGELEPDHLVAEPDGGDGGFLAHGPAQGRERVGHVEEHGVGRVRLDGPGDVDHDRDAAQGAHDPARPHAVADRLAQAVGGGDLDVVHHGGEAADRQRGQDELGALAGRRGGRERPWR